MFYIAHYQQNGIEKQTWIVCESLAWPRISNKAGSDMKKNLGNTNLFFSRYLLYVKKKINSI